MSWLWMSRKEISKEIEEKIKYETDVRRAANLHSKMSEWCQSNGGKQCGFMDLMVYLLECGCRVEWWDTPTRPRNHSPNPIFRRCESHNAPFDNFPA